ncbi:hypothetical protein BDR26DRAFT_868520 [Obelidium mucronatum]|nr:hypothetical protein BDR26DRAFT_868520 [Obelidium mucronatum]
MRGGGARRPFVRSHNNSNNNNNYNQRRGNAMDLDYDRPVQHQQQQQQQQPLVQQQHQEQQPHHPASSVPASNTVTILSIKNLHYNAAAQDLLDAVLHLDGGKTPSLQSLPQPKLEYDNSDRSTGGAVWYIPSHSDAVRVAHLLNNEVLDNLTISVSILSMGVAINNNNNNNQSSAARLRNHAAPAANGAANVLPAQNNLRGVKGSVRGGGLAGANGGGGIAKKSKLLSRLGPPTVLARLGPKKEDLLKRLGPKTNGPTILGRLGEKPGAAAGSGGVGAKKGRRGGKRI